MTWANQIRILKQQFEALSAIIGQNFIYALKPLVSALNTVMGKLIQFARVVSNSLGKIFGWKYEDTTGGIADDLEFGADAADDLGGGLGGAADKAKKLKQQLQGFDELNVLTTNTPSSGGAGGGGGVSDLPQASYGQWVPTDDDEGFFSSELDTLYKLGEYISTTLTDQLRSIDWQEVYQGAKDFGTGLASFLNGLISVDLFSATGATIAGALNTAIYSTLSFGQEFDFEEFGLSIAEGINTFFRDTDFSALGQDIKTWVQGLKTTLITIIKEIEWGDVLAGIGDILKSLDAETIATLFGFGVLKTLFKNGLFGALSSGLSTTTELPTGMITGLKAIAKLIFNKFTLVLGVAFANFKLGNWIYEQYSDEIDEIVEYVLPDIEVKSEREIVFEQALRRETEGYTLFDDNYIEGVERANQYTEQYFEALNSGMQEYEAHREAQLYLDQNYGFNSLLSSIKDIPPAFKNAGSSTSKATKTLKAFGVSTEDLADITNKSFKRIAKDGKVFSVLADTLPQYAAVVKDGVSEHFSSTSDNINNIINYITNTIFGDTYVRGVNDVENQTKQMAKNSSIYYRTMADSVSNDMFNITGSATSANKTITESYKRMAADTNNNVTTLTNSIFESFSNLKNSTNSVLSKLNENTKTKVSFFKNNVINGMNDTVNGASDKFSDLVSVVGKEMNNATAKVKDVNWYTTGTNLVEGLRKGVSNKWNEGPTSLTTNIVSLASNLTNKLKEAFGIHSPSRVWRDDIGYYLTQGLEVGILGEEGHLSSSIVSMGARLTDTMSGALTLATPSSLSSNYDFGVTSTMSHSFSADTSMTSNIADGVRLGLSASQAEQNALLREQNELLYQLLQKETISSDDVYNVVVNKNRDTFNRTGYNPLMA